LLMWPSYGGQSRLFFSFACYCVSHGLSGGLAITVYRSNYLSKTTKNQKKVHV
jgi:hypothetical protein